MAAGTRGGPFPRLLLLDAPLAVHGLRLERSRVVGHPIEPVADHRAGHDRRGFLDQDEKGGLESVLGVGLVAEDAPAHPQDHRPVPPGQRLERGLSPDS